MVKIQEYLKTVKPFAQRTPVQNNAIHKDCDLIAQKLNDMGLDMRTLLKQEVNIPWTVATVKEFIYKPFLKKLYNKESTKELEKHEEIEKLHDTIMRELGEKKGVEYHPFPFDPIKKKAFEESFNVYEKN